MAPAVRLLGYPLLALLGLVIIGVTLLTALSATETGSRWLLRQIQQQVPGELGIAHSEGTLLGGLALDGIDYTLDRDRLQIGHLEFRWQPAALLSATLQVGLLSIRDASYETPAGEEPAEFALPERIVLPLAITLGTGRIHGLQIRIGEQHLEIEELALAGRIGPVAGLRVDRLQVRMQETVLDARGAAGLQQPYSFHAQVNWRSRLADGVALGGKGRLSGDVRRIRLTHRLKTGEARVETRGTLGLEGDAPRFALDGSWQALQWPLTGAADYISREGEYRVEGVPESYRFELTGRLEGSGLPPLGVQAQGRGDTRQLELEPLTLTALDGRLVARGRAVWEPEPALDLQLQASDLNPGQYWSDWQGRIHGSARLTARFSPEPTQVALADIDLQGELRGYPLQVRGGLGLAGERLSATGLQIRSGANRIALSGALDARDGLGVQVNAPELAALWPGLEGRMEASGRLQGTLAQPGGRGRLSATGLAWQELTVDAVKAQFTIDARQLENSSADVNATGVRLSAAAPPAGLSLHARGWLDEHRLELETESRPGHASLALAGRYQAARWEGELARATFDLHSLGEWRLRRPLVLQATARELQPVTACWSAGDAVTCASAEWNAEHDWRAGAQISALPLSPLVALWDTPVAVQGALDAEFNAAGSARGLEARLQAHSAAGELTLQAPEQPPYQSHYHEARLTARYAGEALHLELGARLDEGSVQGSLDLSGLDSAAPALDGTAVLEFPDIRFVNALLPDLEFTAGSVRVQARVGGRLDAPQLSGDAVLEQGGARLPALGLKLEDIRLRAEGRGRRIALRGGLRSGAGELALSGALALDPGASWPFEIDLRGADLDLVQLPDIELSASPELALRGSLARIDVSGRVHIPRARIRVRELPADVVKVSPDQVIIGVEHPPQGERAPPVPVRVNVLATLGEDIRFEGLGLSTGLRGELNIRSLPSGALIGNGVLSLKGGRYEGYGQKLVIERGRLLFAGPLDNPDLDIRATRTVGDVVAGIELTGSLASPETRLFSDPAMPDAEILSYIVTGKPLNSASGGTDSQALASAAASLGANSPVAKEISESLGVDIGTRTGATDAETAVTVGKQLTPRLYVDYLYGLFTEAATLQFIYTLTDHFDLLGETGTEQSIDLRFTLERD